MFGIMTSAMRRNKEVYNEHFAGRSQVAAALEAIGGVSLPEGLTLPHGDQLASSLSSASQHYDALSAILSIHNYRSALTSALLSSVYYIPTVGYISI